MTSSDFDRGWEAGCRSLTKWLYREFKPKRKAGVPSMDVYRFDALVEKHLVHVEPEDFQDEPADNRNRPAAKPDRDGRHVRCPGCKGILSVKTPAACPDCRQPLDREVGP